LRKIDRRSEASAAIAKGKAIVGTGISNHECRRDSIVADVGFKDATGELGTGAQVLPV
jgi:hypothetical protein